MTRQFFKNASFLMIVEIIVKFKSLIILPFLTRHFGTANFGVWSQIGTLMNTITPIIILGTDSGAIRYLSGMPLEEQKGKYTAWYLFLLTTAMLSCFILFLFRNNVAGVFFGEGDEYANLFPLAAGTIFASIMVNSLRTWYRIQNNARVYGMSTVFQALFGIIAVAVMLFRNENVYELILYTLVADLILMFWLLVRIFRENGWGLPDFSNLPLLLRFGFPIIPASYAMWGLNSMDRLFLIKYSTLSEIGIYGLAYSLGYLIIQMFVNPIWNMFPNTASELYNKEKFQELQKLFEQSVGIILLLAFPSLIGLFVLGDKLLMVIATKEFLSKAPVMGIITSGYLFHMLASYYDVYLGLVFRQHLSTISLIVSCLINLGLNILLIPKYSILGAALATALAFFCQLIIVYFLATKYTKIKTDFNYPLKIMVVSILMGLGVYELSGVIRKEGVIPLVILVLFGGVLYGVLLVCFGVIRRENISKVLLLMKRQYWVKYP